ncbi:DUF6766 family protein [Deinococcus aerius]|uniref:DUF6766 family protein n=1 Tax=Deinococcus aerius TaxID=200253 RepID=UPI001F186B1A|nr:DUF6766 family protein [Deinococcus aerius]
MSQQSLHPSAPRSGKFQPGGLRRFWSNNALSIVVFGLFLLFWGGQSFAGFKNYNEDQVGHQQRTVTYTQYLHTSHFWEATGENWESEFLQMGFFVVLTVYLKQRGSSESNPYPDEEQGGEAESGGSQASPAAPVPVNRGGLALVLYRNSLSIALLVLFLLSFAIHVISGAMEYSQEQIEHGGQAVTPLQFLETSQLWFQSLQNWQSEFLAIGAMVVLTIYLRQVGSSQSKPVEAPNSQTGEE